MKKLDRNPQPVLDAVCKVWKKHPDLRVGQILYTAIHRANTKTDSVLFQIENPDLAAAILYCYEVDND